MLLSEMLLRIDCIQSHSLFGSVLGFQRCHLFWFNRCSWLFFAFICQTFLPLLCLVSQGHCLCRNLLLFCLLRTSCPLCLWRFDLCSWFLEMSFLCGALCFCLSLCLIFFLGWWLLVFLSICYLFFCVLFLLIFFLPTFLLWLLGRILWCCSPLTLLPMAGGARVELTGETKL